MKIQSTYRKSMAAALALSVAIPAIVIPVDNQSVSAASSTSFSDVPTKHWAYSSIMKASQQGLVVGYNGKFKPNDNVTRAEFAATLSRVFDGTERVKNTFSDVPGSHWSADAVNEGIALGFIKPNDFKNNKFVPSQAMTRGEIAKWFVDGLVAKNPEYAKILKEFESDLTLLPVTEFLKGGIAKKDIPYVAIALGTGLIGGYSDSSFKPSGKTTRAEVVTMLFRYMNIIQKEPSAFSGLNELREVANTGTNMKSIANFTTGTSTRTFPELLNEPYKLKNGIGTIYVNRVILVDMRDKKNPKGIYKNMFLYKNGESTLKEWQNKGSFYFGTEHRFVPSKKITDSASYLFANGNPFLLSTTGIDENISKPFGYTNGLRVNYKDLKVGKSTYMWFGGQIAPNNYEKYPNSLGIMHSVNNKLYYFGKDN